MNKINQPIDRRHYIGGTDISAVVGLNRWKTALDLYHEKTSLEASSVQNESPLFDPQTEWQYWGKALESVIMQRWLEDNAEETTLLNYDGPKQILPSEHIPAYLNGTPDGVYCCDKMIVVEVKTSRTADGWGEPGTDQVPIEYILQTQWYMHLLALSKHPLSGLGFTCEIPVLIGGSDYRVYKIDYNADLGASLYASAVNFWENHVIPRIPPVATTLREVATYIPANPESTIVATNEVLDLIDVYRSARQVVSSADSAKDKIASFMGEAVSLTDLSGEILATFKADKNGKRSLKIK